MNTHASISQDLNDKQSVAGLDDLPGDFAIWIFIFAEMLAFGLLFIAYAFSRAHNVELFNASQLTLDRTSGAINSLALISRSYCVMRAVAAIKKNLHKSCAH